MTRLRLLGPVEVVDDDGSPLTVGGPKERRVLAALAVHLGQPVSEARLLDALWGDDPPATATKTLQSYVSRLRKALGASEDLRIDSVESGYVLQCAPGAVDTAEVDALVVDARAAAAYGRLDEAADRLREAEGWWRGPVLGDLAYEPFALAEASRLEELRLSLAEERVEIELARGRHNQLVSELEALTARFPLRERLWGARMLALYRSGRQADALRAFQDLRRLLGEELGIDPSPELRALEEAVLLQSASLDWQPPPAPAPTAPPTAGLPSGVVTFLLTDVEGSTRLWDALPREMDAALQRHDAILTAAVEAEGGRLLKSRGEGDSSFSVFTRASQAAVAALAAQAALDSEAWPDGISIQVRMAIHMGEAAERDNDYFGPAVNRVARLRALAAGGEVLVSRSAAEVLADHVDGGFHLVELGERELKDLARPEHVYALVPAGSPADQALRPASVAALEAAFERPPMARALARGDLCVGRDEDLAHLDALWAKARGGERQAVLVGGEPGIGKTTLAATLAAKAYEAGAVVLFGRCDEDMGVAHQPFAEAVRSLLTGIPDHQIRGLGYHASHLMRLLPELPERLPDHPKPIPADADAERFTLFEAVVAVLASVAGDTPVVLIVDDLHWASQPTMAMLRHLLRAETPMRLLVVGTYRDTEVDRAHAFGDALVDLRREVTIDRIALTGLDRAAVQHLVAATAGHELDGAALELSDSVHRQTSGNPFFVSEVLRNLAESGAIYPDDEGRWTSDLTVADLGLPEGVRDVVGRRLSRLSDNTNQVLQVAAVVGPRVGVRLLETIDAAGDPSTVLDSLEEAAAAGLVIEDRGTFSFAHALVRQTLLDELSSIRRLRLHRAIGEAIELTTPDDLEALAFHFAEAAADGAAAKAADYALAAAQSARQKNAYEQASAHLDRGLEAIELTNPIDRARRYDLLLEAAELHRVLKGWNTSETRELGLRAVEDARSIGSSSRLARAALVATLLIVGTEDAVGMALVEEALAGLTPDDHVLRVLLLDELALQLINIGRWEEGEGLQAEVDDLIRHAPADVAMELIRVTPVAAHRAGLATSAAPDEFRTAEFLLAVAQTSSRAAMSSGDVAGLDAAIDEVRTLAEATSAWEATYTLRCFTISRSLINGHWADAEESLELLLDHAGGNPDASAVWAGHQVVLLRDQGRLGEVLPLLEEAVASNPNIPAFRAALALALVERGDPEAPHIFAPLAGPYLRSVSRDAVFPLTMAMVAEVAARLPDEETCRHAYDLTLPFAGTTLSIGGFIVTGSGDRCLGMLAFTLGQLDDAERHFEAALDFEERMGARPWLARTRTWFGRMLLERAGPGDVDRAKELLAVALADADDLAMVGVAAEIRELLRPPLPRALARGDLCLGRDEDLGRLAALWDKAVDGQRQAALIGGEPGIGKTTIAATLASRVDAQGGVVLYGRCDEDLGAPFQPFAEALRSLVATLPDEQLMALRHHASHLTRLLPELADRLPDLAPPIPADAEAERYTLFEAVSSLLATAGATAPMLLVLDDLHWAAKPTLMMLRHLLRAEADLRLLIIATYRDTEVDRSHALADALADLRRETAVTRFSLTGLDRAAVENLVATTAGHELDAPALELSDSLHRQTGGNPFFVAEVLRHLAESGAIYQDDSGRWTSDVAVDELGLPEGVRDVIGRRLSRLSSEANEALTVGAVVGARFDLRLLEAVQDAGEPRVILNALEEGVAAGLLSEDRGTYAFPHALVRQTLLEELTSTRRLRLHRSIGEALESIAPDAVEALAFHFAEAATVDPECATKACDHALSAARRSHARSAYEEAVAHLERGLEAVELTAPIDRERRCDLLLELGELQRRILGRSADCRRRGVQAANDARALGSADRLARAAIVAMYPEVGTPDPIGVALVEEALAVLGDGDLALRLPLVSLLASHRTESEGRWEEGEALRKEVQRLARGVPPEVAAAAIFESWQFNGSAELYFLAEILSAVPAERLTAEQLTLKAQVRAVSAFDDGDLEVLDALLDDLRRLAEETHAWTPGYMTLALSISRALMDGRWDVAEDALGKLADHAGDTLNALNVWSANQVLLLREQGHHDEILTLIQHAAESNPGIPAFRAGHALFLAEAGRLDEAVATLGPLAGDGVAAIPRDQTISVTLAMLAEAAARTRGEALARELYDGLIPFGGRLASVIGTVVVGAADRYLGMLAATLGRFDDAERHFEVALDLESRLGARAYLVRTRSWYGRMLQERDAGGDQDRAADLLATALAEADELRMAAVAAEIRDLNQRL